ncbi:hypothetical protein BY458DRAFT_536653 [Sporodiniella umbellata]|nr:hypothetical protein BY458DRAFT_536653 [Sporodiniella umbellata]
MLISPPTTDQRRITPGFIDFASHSFDAIFFSNRSDVSLKTTNTSQGEIYQRSSHLPDLIPFISLITEKCDIQPVHLVMALMYVQRFKNALPESFKAEPEAAHRIFIASLLIANKYSEDRCLSTQQVVRATGDVWSIKEITRMELAFLRFLHWDLYIRYEDMVQFLKDLNFDVDSVLARPTSENP